MVEYIRRAWWRAPGGGVEMQGGAEREERCGGQGSGVHGRRQGQLPGLMGGGQSRAKEQAGRKRA